MTQDSHRRHLVEWGFRLNSPACRQRRKKDSQSRNLSTPLYKQKSHTQSSLLKTDYKPYLTLFHADISLALSLSISSSSPAASLLAPWVCGGLTPKLPCRSMGCCCLPLSTSSSCMTPPTYCAALGETEFMAPRLQSLPLVLLIATQNWWMNEKEEQHKNLGKKLTTDASCTQNAFTLILQLIYLLTWI